MPDGAANAESNLPTDVAVLQGMIRELLATNREQQRRIDQLVHQVHQLTKRLYGPRADTLNPNQLHLFDEPPPGDTPVSPPPVEPTVIIPILLPFFVTQGSIRFCPVPRFRKHSTVLFRVFNFFIKILNK